MPVRTEFRNKHIAIVANMSVAAPSPLDTPNEICVQESVSQSRYGFNHENGYRLRRSVCDPEVHYGRTESSSQRMLQKRANEKCRFIMQDNITYSTRKSKNAQCSLESVTRRMSEKQKPETYNSSDYRPISLPNFFR